MVAARRTSVHLDATTREGLAAVAVAALACAAMAAPAVAQRGPTGFFDSRDAKRAAKLPERPDAERAVRALDRSLGPQGLVDLDPLTGTPRFVGRADGFLTGRSTNDAAEIVRAYLAAKPAVFGLDAAAVEGLRVARRHTSPDGVTLLRFEQVHEGIPALGNGVSAAVTRDGRLLNVRGAPIPDLSAPSTRPGIGSGDAVAAALRDVGSPVRTGPARGSARGARSETHFAGGHSARLALLGDGGGARLVWRVVANDRGRMYDVAVDAADATVLRRKPLFADANALVFRYHPGAAVGGTQEATDITAYLDASPTQLSGPFAFAFSDLDGDAVVDSPAEQIPPSAGSDFNYAFTAFDVAHSGCDQPAAAGRCSWNPAVGSSWQTNRRQGATQALWFNSTFHDHLAAPPIDFTPARGNFEGSSGNDADRVNVATSLAANGSGGVPSGDDVNNAFMSTPPDGDSPFMGLYLFRTVTNAPFRAIHAADDAGIVYHEYAHGLSNRLVVDSMGFSGLLSHQANSMGEGWSDWYAFDYLVGKGLAADTAADGELSLDRYASPPGESLLRHQPLDCVVGTAEGACPGSAGAGSGGFTFGDMGRISPFGPEVHADGEIWAETLWDLRVSVGVASTRQLVTRAMELSPVDPSFLDMRNAILQADTAGFAGAHHPAIWQVFAGRGMGYFASVEDGRDTQPVESFALPPDPNGPKGTITGAVTADGAALQGARVAVGGHDSGFTSDLAATSGQDGRYSIAGVPAGTYPHLLMRAAAHEPKTATGVPVAGGGTTARDFATRRDWASVAGGASAAVQPGIEDYASFGCGAPAAVDLDQGTTFSTTAPTFDLSTDPQPGPFSGSPAGPGERRMTVTLPRAIDITSLEVDPTGGCGDDTTASTREYRIETSTNGTTFNTAVTGSFGAGDLFRLNALTPSGAVSSGVTQVRFVIVSTLNSSSGSGSRFADLTDLRVFGRAHVPPAPAGDPATAPPASPPPGAGPVRFAGLSFVARQTIRSLIRSGLRSRVTIAGACPCVVRQNLQIGQRDARRLGLASRNVTIGRGAARVERAGTVALRARLTRGARKALARSPRTRRLSLVVRTVANDASGAGTTRVSRLRLRR